MKKKILATFAFLNCCSLVLSLQITVPVRSAASNCLAPHLAQNAKLDNMHRTLSSYNAQSAVVSQTQLADFSHFAASTPFGVQKWLEDVVTPFGGNQAPVWHKTRHYKYDGQPATISEGLGYSMWMSLESGDVANFHRILDFTMRKMVSDTGVICWLFDNEHRRVIDKGSAPDGDLDVLEALMRADQAGVLSPDEKEFLFKLAAAVAKHDFIEMGGRSILKVGDHWGVSGKDVTYNPSYIRPLTMLRMAQYLPEDLAARVTKAIDDGIEITRLAQKDTESKLIAHFIQLHFEGDKLEFKHVGDYSWDSFRIVHSLIEYADYLKQVEKSGSITLQELKNLENTTGILYDLYMFQKNLKEDQRYMDSYTHSGKLNTTSAQVGCMSAWLLLSIEFKDTKMSYRILQKMEARLKYIQALGTDRVERLWDPPVMWVNKYYQGYWFQRFHRTMFSSRDRANTFLVTPALSDINYIRRLVKSYTGMRPYQFVIMVQSAA